MGFIVVTERRAYANGNDYTQHFLNVASIVDVRSWGTDTRIELDVCLRDADDGDYLIVTESLSNIMRQIGAVNLSPEAVEAATAAQG